MKTKIRRLTSGGAVLALAALLGAATFVATLAFLNSSGESDPTAATVSESPAGRDAAVIVPRQDVAAGVELTASMLETRQVPVETVLAGSVTGLDEAVGRITRYPLLAGEQVTASKLVGTGGGTGLTFSVPAGMRAMSIPISQVITAGGLIVPGDRVDVLVSTTYERLFEPGDPLPEDHAGRPVVFTLLQDVLVLAVAQTITPPLDPDGDPSALRNEDAEPQPAAGTATIAVTPEQTQLLFMASEQGKLSLALRPFGEPDVEVLEPRLKLEPVFDSVIGFAAREPRESTQQ